MIWLSVTHKKGLQSKLMQAFVLYGGPWAIRTLDQLIKSQKVRAFLELSLHIFIKQYREKAKERFLQADELQAFFGELASSNRGKLTH